MLSLRVDPQHVTDAIHRTRRLRWFAALAAVFFLGGLCGSVVVHRRIFPYPQLAAAKHLLFPRDAALSERPQTIETSVVRLEKRTYNPTDPGGLMGHGGGLARVRGAVLGVDRTGTFFVYRSAGEIRRMDLGLDSNREAYLRHVSASYRMNPRARG